MFSLAGAPPVLALPTALLAGLRGAGHPPAGLCALEMVVPGCLMPVLVTVLLHRAGRTSTLDLRDRADRLLPSIATTLGCLLGWGALCLSGAPGPLSNLAAGIVAQMAVLTAVTTCWKVSYHAAAAAALVAVSRAPGSPGLTLALLALAVGVGWARVYLRRHTPAQVAVGALTAVPLALLG